MYPYGSDKTNAKKIRDIQKIYVYSYRRAHRRASCSAGVLRRGCGAVTYNTAVNLLKTSWAPLNFIL